jgi:hypothetical protein
MTPPHLLDILFKLVGEMLQYPVKNDLVLLHQQFHHPGSMHAIRNTRKCLRICSEPVFEKGSAFCFSTALDENALNRT